MPRLFTGLEIPKEVAQHLMLLRGDVPGARWIDPDSYHITLRFLGDVSAAVAEEYDSRLARLTLDPFEVELEGVSWFGSRHPHTLWVGVKPSEALVVLYRAHERAALSVGLEPETRDFTPHVTLARLTRTRLTSLAPFLADFAGFRTRPYTVRRALLYSSRPSTGGGPYAIEAAYPFSGEEEPDEPVTEN